ncbi:GntR family transcriptional regulator [Metabacillus endolithicus]|uniref:GntR family transcriptional regulator n=1 Tax=Metabacillus endolithicus TaxID=1535204 RepID=A0ABW5C0R0_9BACI|nr:GntR family transcriptional regulator [Metabacillus endolithicus]UPG62458.1 GntR family transcriptional regulator [Metabacillus endolithicus]
MNKKPNKRQIAYEVIRKRIIEGVYVPGQRIIIDQIAKEVGSSHIPVREAIHQLESEELIEYTPNTGAVVKGVNDEIYKESLQVLALLEGYATAISTPYLSTQALETLKDYNQEMKEALSDFDFEKIGALNRTFHFFIYSYCPNQLLIKNIEQLWDRIDAVRKIRSSFTLKRTPKSIEEHDQLISILQDDKNLIKIESLARQHKLNTLQTFIEQQES